MNTCFVAMPISVPQSMVSRYEDKDHFIHVYEHLFAPAIRELEFEPISPVSKGSEVIHADIVRNLHDAHLVLCDMSTLNANVFFELGIRTALDKPVCIVADSATVDLPFDTGIINRHNYEAVLRIWNIEEQKRALVRHMKDTLAKSDGRSSLWRHFGIETSGKFKPASYTESDKLDYLIQMINNFLREKPKGRMRGFNLALDAHRVGDWAARYKAPNAWDMGPRNFERCLFDLGLDGGVDHELVFADNGNLKYQ